jgi:predicted AlkP superfamily pyrophosphatase or phosphodiesterase
MLRSTEDQVGNFANIRIALLLFLFGGGALGAETNRHVVVISIDGLAAGYLTDPKAEIPTIRSLAKRGVKAQRMRVCEPSVTVVNHTSLVTGMNPERHGIYANWVLERPGFKVVRFGAEMGNAKSAVVVCPTIYDRAKDAGLTTAAIAWPMTYGAESFDWLLCPAKTQNGFEASSTPGLLAEMTRAGISSKKIGFWARQGLPGAVGLDGFSTDAAVHLIREHSPNLLLLHLTALDFWQHHFGCYTPQAYAKCRESDANVSRVVAAIEAAGLRDLTTVLIVADHGFTNADQVLAPQVLLSQAGIAGVRTTSHGGCNQIYVTGKADRGEVCEKVRNLFAERPEIDRVVWHRNSGGARPSANGKWRPDLTIYAKAQFVFTDSSREVRFVSRRARPSGTHGHHPALPAMAASFVAAGSGVRAGVELDEVRITDVTPTIGRLLGIAIGDTDGNVLREMLLDQVK